MRVTPVPQNSSTTTTNTLAPPAPEVSRGSLRIVAVRGAQFCRPLHADKALLIGRCEAADVQVPCTLASRKHARIRGRLPMIEDLGSANGTYVNGVRIVSHSEVPLVAGSVVTIGTVTLVVEECTELAETEADKAAGSVATDPGMRAVIETVRAAARSSLTVLLLGETGVGKERLAALVHRHSPRAQRRFLQLNCAALPDSLLEAELFGHERGAFTGAVAARVGLLEAANGGTLFLDEVGEMTLAGQAKLLRFLESGEVQRLGAVDSRVMDTRVVAATNRCLLTQIARGEFRADLYYRLAGVVVTVPPLRNRRTDIRALASVFLNETAAREGLPVPIVTEEAWTVLNTYAWPGNVRELRSVIQRAVVLCRTGRLSPESLFAPEAAPSSGAPTSPCFLEVEAVTSKTLSMLPPRISEFVKGVASQLPDSLAALERKQIEDALVACGGNQSRAAELLGITRRMLVTRLDKYGIVRPRKSRAR